MKPIRILIACETSGATRRAFEKRWGDRVAVVSCDLLPADDGATNHYQGSVFDILNDGWDYMLAHPPCTYLTSSGLHWNKRVEGRAAKTEEALEFVRKLLAAPIPFIALENPQGRIGTAIRKADQYIQPYDFGEDASKKTGLWLVNLPLLVPTKRIEGRWVQHNGKMVERWSNQTDSGQNRLPPSDDRWKIRSETYQGIADAIADQHGSYIMRQLQQAA